MAGYLLHASAIWLFSLAVFELLFRKETVHAWNRTYLLCTLALGFVLPLLRWDHPEAAVNRALQIPLRRFVVSKELLLHTETTAPAAATVKHSLHINWMLAGYCCGLAIAAALVIQSVILLIRLYNGGRRSRAGAVTLVDTRRVHGPFSFFNLVFVSSQRSYDKAEFDLMLQHEARHAALLHSLDAVLMQLLRCVLWFHPLLHWYHFRLRMVHEFQADAPARTDVRTYGRFLIEQAMLSRAPSFTHAFHQSPLKNRIQMLTKRRSAGLRLGRYLLVVPLISISFLCCTRQQIAPRQPQALKTDTAIYFHGRRIEMGQLPDMKLSFRSDSLSPDEIIFSIGRLPVKIDDQVIYYEDQLEQQPRYNGTGSAAEAVFTGMKPLLDKLDDGLYTLGINNAVVDEKGVLAYYDVSGLDRSIPFRRMDERNVSGEAEMMDPKTGGWKKAVAVSASEGATEVTTIGNQHVMISANDPAAGSSHYNFNTGEWTGISSPYKQEIDAALTKLLDEGKLRFHPGTRNGLPVAAGLNSDLDLTFSKRIRVTGHQAVLENNPDDE